MDKEDNIWQTFWTHLVARCQQLTKCGGRSVCHGWCKCTTLCMHYAIIAKFLLIIFFFVVVLGSYLQHTTHIYMKNRYEPPPPLHSVGSYVITWESHGNSCHLHLSCTKCYADSKKKRVSFFRSLQGNLSTPRGHNPNNSLFLNTCLIVVKHIKMTKIA